MKNATAVAMAIFLLMVFSTPSSIVPQRMPGRLQAPPLLSHGRYDSRTVAGRQVLLLPRGRFEQGESDWV